MKPVLHSTTNTPGVSAIQRLFLVGAAGAECFIDGAA